MEGVTMTATPGAIQADDLLAYPAQKPQKATNDALDDECIDILASLFSKRHVPSESPASVSVAWSMFLGREAVAEVQRDRQIALITELLAEFTASNQELYRAEVRSAYRAYLAAAEAARPTDAEA